MSAPHDGHSRYSWRAAWAFAGLAALLSAHGCSGNGSKECASVQPSDACSDHVTNACNAADGCSVGPSCIRVSCYAITALSDCKAIATCSWVDSAQRCVFTTENDPCSGLLEQPCQANDACSWQVTCNGQIKSCQGLNATECAAVPHCYMETVPNLN